ncbi:hypothetical protein KFE25_012931 [Diacronema lutheri]|uniref:Uncharacterized protein n=2 Tax=Diacronema lutheri TaxID=2081491 RepID=A0A8J5X3W8_DIALT|nr:hypothetical protein KFE25_012931 [Diacronema lutheri]
MEWPLQPVSESSGLRSRAARSRINAPEQLAWWLRVRRTRAQLVRFHRRIGSPRAVTATNERLGATRDFFEYYERRPRQARQSLGHVQDMRRLVFTITTLERGTLTQPDEIIAFAAADAGHQLVWQMADQSVLAPITAELQQWADLDLSIAVCAVPGSVTFDLNLPSAAEGSLRVRADFAISTVKGADEEQLLLGTLRVRLEADADERVVRQVLEAAEPARRSRAELHEAAAAIAERQAMLNAPAYRRDVAHARAAMRAALAVLVLALASASALFAFRLGRVSA